MNNDPTANIEITKLLDQLLYVLEAQPDDERAHFVLFILDKLLQLTTPTPAPTEPL